MAGARVLAHPASPATPQSLPHRSLAMPPSNNIPLLTSRRLFPAILLTALAACLPSSAQVNGLGQRPFLGWSSFSEQTINGGFLTQANIQAQSDALKASGLQQHGFVYINID